MKKLGTLVFVLIVSSLPILTFGQVRKQVPLEAGVTAGFANYAGDLAGFPFEWQEFRLASGVQVRAHFSSRWSLQAQYLNTFLTGNDRNLANLAKRSFQFSTKVNELSLRTDFQLVSLSRHVSLRSWLADFSFFGFVGGGWSFVKPVAKCNGLLDDCDKILKVPFPEPNTPSQMPLLLGGMGVRYFDGMRLFSSIELGMRAPFSDLLDGVSINAESNFYDYYFMFNASVGLLLNRSLRHTDFSPNW